MSRVLIVLLHGIGSSGGDLAPLGTVWRDELPLADFAAPDAPFACDRGPGRQWFSASGVTPANRPERVAGGRAGFDETVGGIIAAHGLTERLDLVALFGFSQGAIMALDALATGRWPVRAVVAFAGRLASPPPLTPATRTRALLIHGEADRVIPKAESEHAAETLRALSVDVAVRMLPRVGHTISRKGSALAAAFLREAFDQPATAPDAGARHA